ncbi:MAG: hypothetical protein NC911_09095 [Candidatus Omnitrophica bacterium]|nr:hypothetical protein [Candidatus Omnitrophota bacterium]
MPFYLYQARTERQKTRKGLLRSPDQENGWQFLKKQGWKVLSVRLYCQPNYQAIWVTAFFFIVLASFLTVTLPGQLATGRWPAYWQLLICVTGYYLSAFLLWSTLPATERIVFGQTIPCWELSLGLSLVVLLVLVVTLGLKLKVPVVLGSTGLAAIGHFWLLREDYLHLAVPVYQEEQKEGK